MEFRYKIVEENGQQVLYIYLDHYFEEFSKELGTKVEDRKQSLSRKVNDYLNRNNINFTGNMVKVFAGTLVFATLFMAPTVQDVSAQTISSPKTIEVQSGDSLWSIGREYGVSIDELRQMNNLTTDVIQPGQSLNIGQQTLNVNVYTVQSGDSLWNISRNTNLSIDEIKEYNNLTTDTIHAGQRLLLVPNAEIGTYTVRSGDSLWAIANNYAMDVDDLKALNGTTDVIYPGQVLQVIQARAPLQYTVQPGDSLWSIATKHDMSVADLQEQNNLDTAMIQPGQTLFVTNQTRVTAPETETTTREAYNVTIVSVRRYNGVVENIQLEDYVKGVVASELGPGFNEGAYKSQALAARTYAMQLAIDGETLSDTDRHQVYHDTYQLKQLWGTNFDRDYSIIENAVEETRGEVIEYNGELINALFFSTSNGTTENPVYVWGGEEPYLQAVDSHWDTQSPYFYRETTFTNGEFASRLGVSQDSLYANVLSRTDGGGINSINIAGRTFSGEFVRSKLGLRSTDYDITFSNGTVNIAQRGWGHRVGLSQYGAYYMAQEGYNYHQIIEHYYPGVDIVTP